MKLPLLLSAAFMLLSSISAKNSEPQLRGVSVDNEDESFNFKDAPSVIFEGSDPFNDGVNDGKRAANQLWRDMGNDCANAFDFESEAKKEARSRGWNQEGRNWQERAYNEGARSGMEEVVRAKEKSCLHDNPSQCIGLGEAASSMIVRDYCGGASGYSTANYKRECRDAAISQCKGGIFGKIDDTSGCRMPNTSTLNDLQNQCRDQVDQLLGIDSGGGGDRDATGDRCQKGSDCGRGSEWMCRNGRCQPRMEFEMDMEQATE